MAWRILFLLLVLLGISPVGEVRAQDGSSVYSVNRPGSNAGGPLQWIFGNRPQRANPHIVRVPQPARAYEPRRRSTYASRPQPNYDRPAAALPAQPTPAPGSESAPADGTTLPQTADTPAATPPVEPQRPPVQIGIIGDSLSIFLAQGLQETYADRQNVQFIRRHREASGLVRDDYYDWPRQLRDLIATTPKLDAILIQIGSNDRQQLRDADGVHDPRSPRWSEIYTKRIDDVIAIARDAKIPLIWVGLPTMRGERYNADMLAFNEFYKARTVGVGSHSGATYVDVWEAFAGEDGAYAVNGPDVEGTNVRLRTADGVHFTKAGSRKLAFFADKELKKIVASVESRNLPRPSGVAVTAPAPLQTAPTLGPNVVLPALPEPHLPAALKSTDTLLGVAVPDIALPTPLIARPMQGPVVSLSKAPVASGGTLLTATPPARVDDLFRDGVPGTMKPGRADDFSLRP